MGDGAPTGLRGTGFPGALSYPAATVGGMTEPIAAEPPYVREIRTAYDTVAADYADLLRSDLAGRPLERAMLGAFAELVLEGRPVADIGCGPGRITGYLDELGLDVFGVDLSPGMIEVARRDHPRIPFTEGSMLALDLADGSLGGLVAWYSVIHTPPEHHPRIFAEFRRVLAPGAPLLVGFKVGDRRDHLDRAYGHELSLDVYWLPPERVTALLTEAGFTVSASLHCEPGPLDRQPQAYLMARLPVPAAQL